ncbi:manganese-binding transcriptional regulator MntR [Halomonas dongshanensis]|uniref:Transcriptional regulator MntR n=1 Tax=Halomonas dongshanensis TaxID=2890835 RepID=A0ABT2EH43_9GAMM|nr:manganese-binding transcriptional regulator MntR [Halomonas dongshanensis]MCS2610683.1 manganese-binding transcriptional regulator MntR [Halomonas dongshanensis]
MSEYDPRLDADQSRLCGDALPPVEQHVRQYETVRNAHETELIEDYVELIGDLIEHRGEARAADLANRMGVSQATVSKMIRRLNELGLVNSRPYRSLFLTQAGQDMAQTSRARHDVVLHFLRALGVPDTTARIDAEGMEHHVSDETLTIMQRFTERQSANN